MKRLQGSPLPAWNSQLKDEQQGLYEKYTVTRNYDHKGKHKGCIYFVLDVRHDEFAGVALKAYADAAESKFPKLAKDIRLKLGAPVAALEGKP